MKRTLAIISAILLAVSALAQPKYVFYFIGDGMGVNEILLTEFYKASLEGTYGTSPLGFTQFPVASFSTTYSASSLVTDSAASGTALATGQKTRNSRIGMDVEATERIVNMAEMAKRSGKKVGVLSTTNINHATPAAFAGHQPDRNDYYEISLDMIANGFDFYGGNGIYNEEMTRDGKKAAPIRPQFEQAGYTICNVEGFQKCWKDAEKMLVLPEPGETISYRIDADNDKSGRKHILLKELVESAVTFLMKDNKKGFFLMAEGGEIDHACHSRDAATMVEEIIDFDEAIAVAVEFYKKYPKQTLIVVTSDHETGGLVIKPNRNEDIARLANQKHSINVLSDMIKERIAKEDRALTWAETRAFLEENLGLWTKIHMNWEDERTLHDIYDSTIAHRQAGSVKDLYADNAKLVAAAIQIFNNKCRVYWQGSGHTSCAVPVFAIGAGSENFTHKTDNAQIARDIIRIAAYK